MLKKILYIAILLFGLKSYCQAQKQEKDIAASMVYGFFFGMETSLKSIYESEPELGNLINELKLLRTTNFPNSKKNAYEYLKKETDFVNFSEKKFDSLQTAWRLNVIVSSKEEKLNSLKVIENYLKGNIPSPMLENVLSFEYQDQPHKEFVNGYKFTFSTKGHKKAKNAEFSIEIPKSWTATEGRQPNVIKQFRSDCGNGSSSVIIITNEMPYKEKDIENLTLEEIDKLYRQNIFTEEYAKNFIDGEFISYKPMDISGRAGFQIVCEVVKEIMGEKIKMRSINYIFHDITYLHYISCSISTKNMLEDLEKKSKNINSLFYMIVNSIVVPRKNNDIIELKGSEHQKIIDVKIGGTKFEFIFDTGASISLISKNVINNLLENGIITKRNFLEKKYIVTADGKNHLVELWNLPNIVIDGKKINDINFAVMEGNIQPLLGMNIINKLNIYKIDLDDNKIYLKN